MIKKESRNSMRLIRHKRIRNKIMGTSEVPRLSVYRSNTGIYAQIISASSLDKDLNLKNGSNVEAAKVVGKSIAEKAKKANITKVVFDRGGYLYHARVEALANAARENGLEF